MALKGLRGYFKSERSGSFTWTPQGINKLVKQHRELYQLEQAVIDSAISYFSDESMYSLPELKESLNRLMKARKKWGIT